jgi:hypothetical protein
MVAGVRPQVKNGYLAVYLRTTKRTNGNRSIARCPAATRPSAGALQEPELLSESPPVETGAAVAATGSVVVGGG